MKALPGLAWLLEKEHGLQRQHIGTDQRFQHIDNARMQHESLGDFGGAVRHVDALVKDAALRFAEVCRRHGDAWQAGAPGHQVFGEIGQLRDFIAGRRVLAHAKSHRGEMRGTRRR